MPPRQVEAVMGHEIGHIARRHFRWLLLTAAVFWLVCLELALLAISPLVIWVDPGTQALGSNVGWGLQSAGVALAVFGWLIGFGWVSRRFERQADTFAVQQMSHEFRLAAMAANHSSNPGSESTSIDTSVRVHPHAVRAMTGALRTVRQWTRIPKRRRRRRPNRWLRALRQGFLAWRHGSIPWRQAYLRSLVGRPIDALPIDRQVRWINRATLLCLGLLLAWHASQGL
jgi:Zn-dependent protease with chaperone function